MPNWNAMTIPLTTPMPKDTAKIFCQKKKIPPHRVAGSKPAPFHETKLAKPMVKERAHGS